MPHLKFSLRASKFVEPALDMAKLSMMLMLLCQHYYMFFSHNSKYILSSFF